eukprot:4254173-Prymnesium_polylepis.1
MGGEPVVSLNIRCGLHPAPDADLRRGGIRRSLSRARRMLRTSTPCSSTSQPRLDRRCSSSPSTVGR